MELSNTSIDVVELVVNIAAIVLPILVSLALTAFAGAGTIAAIRKLWAAIRGGVVEAVNEPGDPVVGLIAALLKSDPAAVAKVTRKVAELIKAALDEALQEPAKEVNIGEAVK